MAAAHYSLLRADLWWRLLPLLAATALFIAATLVSGRYLVRRVRIGRWRPLATAGTSELEFALAFPIFLMCVLLTVQLALLINANLIVDYAAFCAARSAAVWVPQNLPGEPARSIAPPGSSGEDDSEKWSRIQRAATMAVLPISPRISRFRFGIDIPREPPPFDPAALGRLAAAADARIASRPGFGRLALTAADKFVYAYFFTDVDLLADSGAPATTFTHTVTARVTHKFEMAVPFAGQVLGMAFGSRYIPLIGGYYIPLSAQYTLMMGQS